MKMSNTTRNMISIFFIGLFCGIILMLLVGCAPVVDPNNPAYAPAIVNQSSGDFTITTIFSSGYYVGFRVEDSKYNTVCYFTHSSDGGVSCIDAKVK